MKNGKGCKSSQPFVLGFGFLVLLLVGQPAARGAVSFTNLIDFTFTNPPNFGWNADVAINWSGALVQGDDGNYYGTTQSGGIAEGYNPHGGGTLFRMTPDGGFTTLYAVPSLFNTNADAAYTGYFYSPLGYCPVGNLAKGTDGALFGTMNFGGPPAVFTDPSYAGYGAVFRLSSDGSVSPIYQFGNGLSLMTNITTQATNVYTVNYAGGQLQAGLVMGSDGNLYGTTISLGAWGNGTIFKLATNGLLTRLHSFQPVDSMGYNADGSRPYGDMAEGGDGAFYGTTYLGGTNGCGILFKITQDGQFTGLHYFNNDEKYPSGKLISGKNGGIYGTTQGGILYQITTNGDYAVVYRFGAEGDCLGGVIQGRDGNFYGMSQGELGAVFQITTNGTLTVLHYFNGWDGAYPNGALVQGSDGSFYGMTPYGGPDYTYGLTGYGTIFRLTLTPDAPVIQAVTQTNGVITFNWNATIGSGYRVQYNTDLTSTNWLNLGGVITATDTNVAGSDIMTNAQRFYRILAVP